MHSRRPSSTVVYPTATLTLLILLTLVAPGHSSAQIWDPDAPPSFAIVVHAENPTEELDQKTLSRYYLRKLRRWGHNVPVEPVDLPRSHPARIELSERIFDKSVKSILSYWQRQVFSDGAVPPLEMGCCAQLLSWLEGRPGGIAYVPVDTPLPALVKAIRIVDEDGDVLVDLPRFGSEVRLGTHGEIEHGVLQTDLARPGRRLESQGTIVLSEVGACGSDGFGSWVVVANEHPHEARSVSIQRTYGTRSRSRSYVDPIDVPASSEWVLGCTRPSREESLSFRIQGVSEVDLAERDTSGFESHRPREVVRVVEGSGCGPHGEGHDLRLINEHPHRKARVVTEHRQTMTGSGSRVFQRNYILEAGQAVKLGCDANHAVALLEVELN